MDKSKELYRAKTQEQQSEISRFAEVTNPTNRTHEIAVTRTLIQEALASGNTTVANSLLNTLDRLQKNEYRRKLTESELITKPSVLRFSRQLVDIFADEISSLDGWEDCLVRVSARVDEALSQLENSAKDIEGVPLPR